MRMGDWSSDVCSSDLYAQLLYAIRGVMLVATEAGHWVVPPTRGMWMPPRTRHAVRMIGSVNMRSAFIDPTLTPDLPTQCAAPAVSPSLRELLAAAAELPPPHAPASRGEPISELQLDAHPTRAALSTHTPSPPHTSSGRFTFRTSPPPPKAHSTHKPA